MLEIRDPVCGMKIEGETVTHWHHFEGTNYYFCSGECLVEFTGNPLAYVNEARECCKGKHSIDPPSKNGHHEGHCQNSYHNKHQCCRISK